MKARKVLTAAAILALVLGAGMPAMAENTKTITEKTQGGSDTTTVNASVTQAYTVTIPTEVNLGELTAGSDMKEADLPVSVSNLLIPKGTQLQISVDGNGQNAAFVIDAGGAQITYCVQKNNSTALSEPGVYAVVNAGYQESATDISGKVIQSSEVEHAGNYSGTLTFVCEVITPSGTGE